MLSPVWVPRAVYGLARTGRVFEHGEVVGPDGRPFTLRTFSGDAPGGQFAQLLSVAAGDMRFVGPEPQPRPAAVISPAPDQTTVADGSTDRPSTRPSTNQAGLFSQERARQDLGITHVVDPIDEDRSLRAAAKLAAKAGITYLVTGGHTGGGLDAPRAFSLLGVRIDNDTMSQAIDFIVEHALDPAVRDRPDPRRYAGEGRWLAAFVNPGCLNIACEDEAYRSALNDMARVWPDGVGVRIAATRHGHAVRENVNGTDLFPLLCARAAKEGLSLFLLGARPGIAQASAEIMVADHPGLKIAGTQHGYFTEAETDQVIERINASGADVLLVAMGVPQQEAWLTAHHDQLTVPVRFGVGALFDITSGTIPRAPLFLREVGLEWVWRLLKEPRRMWRRYVLGNPLFLYRTWKATEKS
ncbi:WecB/TagA/CpsF family glycosyltransferase [Arsenicicoccus piscis]|uniref:Glycosyltransferase n=1 Tax=Arsenicicoccus piscis TaxID=673954 RepID=A0ABQ6HPJ7_9MICO|nr:WecB/TagA/CpsF family glycosyltransferase [Arsenicicoccus piscis]MCH8629159.1 WecB/TagA/CpsF family glycosyltransferase [Arsenicicoccus piscis]GMA20277.1 hypothetical protein GCM10025862_22980 [Arsenicicoccus piscis]